MKTSTAPRIRRTAQNTQFTYGLSRRVNDVQTYPYLSPQGASIIIYGHETGVTVVWRGGKRFKPQKKVPAEEKQNGSADDSVMIIDSDDDEPPAKAQTAPKFQDKPEFEDDVEDTPYPEITQTLDLTLGTAVLKVAVMPLSAKPEHDGAYTESAAILGEKMIFAVSCVTNDVYLITLPLTPPSPESKARPELKRDLLAGKAGSGAWGESLVLLGGQRKLSDGIAIGLVVPDASVPSVKSIRAVVAAYSREASGVLKLWDVPLDPKARFERAIEPFQSEYLPNPLTSISFNPTRKTQLLAVSSPHGVRVYDFSVPSLPPDPEATGPFPAQGSWLLTLYQPFSRPSSMRKPIVDAAWISHGHAVFALLADGMWGIWDIDGAGIRTSGPSMSAKLKLGVRGTALTAFSVSGYLEGTSSLRSVATHKETRSGEFAPMTPHTRRQATAAISTAATADRLATIHGGIAVRPLPPTGKALACESLALWVGSHEHVAVIPDVSRFWASQLQKGSGGGVDLFGASQSPTRMLKLHDLSTGLLGERCCGVSLIVDPARANNTTYNDGGLAVDVLVRGETRLVVVREGDDGPGKKIGGAVTTRRRLFSGKQSSAIIVRGQQPRAASTSFNLSRVQPGSLRMKPSFQRDDGTMAGGTQGANGGLGSRPQVGFNFAATLNEAADVTGEDSGRDVDAEMLDIMGIDQALESLEGGRGAGRRKGLFEEV
ncbi:hypothetical protein ACRE_008930 [Hapsidospora chrysogenum ATCC 11550]|uniref:Uncharacterized protein n=1 Tax=Hapsidospora chrysogenum (strain ATCC 11550 / CBS 779.69 / DSM 880 / IAM 14645 / JCM 23072 / IMI 49137) TaxID=857340 RepID=A0A086TFX8_HAPC1|nr:hypothetical protein ACRE_008930 [Hapsidospora chrysogenum ATCC 11550]